MRPLSGDDSSPVAAAVLALDALAQLLRGCAAAAAAPAAAPTAAAPAPAPTTAEVDLAAASAVGAAVAPEGYELDDSKLGHESDIIGRIVLMKWDGAPIKATDFGWFCGKVKKRLTAAEIAKPENVDCRFWVTFKNSETGGVLPACIGMSARNGAAAFAAALAPEMRACGGEAGGGVDCRWALLRQEG